MLANWEPRVYTDGKRQWVDIRSNNPVEDSNLPVSTLVTLDLMSSGVENNDKVVTKDDLDIPAMSSTS